MLTRRCGNKELVLRCFRAGSSATHPHFTCQAPGPGGWHTLGSTRIPGHFLGYCWETVLHASGPQNRQSRRGQEGGAAGGNGDCHYLQFDAPDSPYFLEPETGGGLETHP